MNPWITLALASLAIAGGAQAAEMKVYKQPSFNGESLTLNGDSRDLNKRGFQDQIASVVVQSGRWQVCTQPDFGGDCVTLDRGEYSRLDERLFHRIESARLVEDRNVEAPRHRDYAEAPRASRWQRGAASSIELYSRPGFEGRATRIEGDRTGLDRRVFSVIVNDGNWQVCSQPNYGGYCRVLEPGQYEDLGRMAGQIGSVRQVG
jgi:hypothetical protein